MEASDRLQEAAKAADRARQRRELERLHHFIADTEEETAQFDELLVSEELQPSKDAENLRLKDQLERFQAQLEAEKASKQAKVLLINQQNQKLEAFKTHWEAFQNTANKLFKWDD